MKIYTDEQNHICAINTTDRTDLTEHDDNGMFEGKCEAYIFGYTCETNYRYVYDEDGNIVVDEDGNPVYELDENGNKIETQHSMYPHQDYNMLCDMQRDYEIKKIKEENDMAVAELTMLMSTYIA